MKDDCNCVDCLLDRQECRAERATLALELIALGVGLGVALWGLRGLGEDA